MSFKIPLDYMQTQIAKMMTDGEPHKIRLKRDKEIRGTVHKKGEQIEHQNKERQFDETIELQVVLRDYNPKKDTRFKGQIVLDYAPYPNLPIAVLGNVNDCDQATSLGIDCINAEQLKGFKKQPKKVKAWSSKYKVLLASDAMMKTVIRTMGRSLVKAGKTPQPIREGDNIQEMHDKLKRTIKFQLKKVIDIQVAVGKQSMKQEHVMANLTKAINFLVSLTKKGWQNIRSIHVKRTMSPAYHLYG